MEQPQKLTHYLAIHTQAINIKKLPDYIELDEFTQGRLNYLVISLFSLNEDLDIVSIETKPFLTTETMSRLDGSSNYVKHHDKTLELVNKFCKLNNVYKTHLDDHIIYKSPEDFVKGLKRDREFIQLQKNNTINIVNWGTGGTAKRKGVDNSPQEPKTEKQDLDYLEAKYPGIGIRVFGTGIYAPHIDKRL